jgi:MOSC domain-containing protein YiiM
MVKSGRSGWYYRVIEEGSVAPGDTLVRAERRHSEWSVERVTGIVIAGRERDPLVLRALAALPELAAEWRARVVQLAG